MERVTHPCLLQHRLGMTRHHVGFRVWEEHWGDERQLTKAHIVHGACYSANVARTLRAHQDNRDVRHVERC
jgi:hypothetical protein